MSDLNSINQGSNLQTEGYAILPDVFSAAEIDCSVALIDQIDSSQPECRRTNDLFAIRSFLKVVPSIQPLIFTPKFIALIADTFGPDYFVVKSIYFDKPPSSNWFVAWHQDLTISVDRKLALPGYGPWTTKGPHFAVQPPVDILQNIYTIRIHLDDSDSTNGALRVLPGSHLRGIERYSPMARAAASHPAVTPDAALVANPLSAAVTCRVPAGGLMLMRPLLQHASSRSTAGKRRRVIHIEFSNAELPPGINWAERIQISAL